MNSFQVLLSLFILLCLGSNAQALDESERAILLDSLVEVTADAGECLGMGSGFYFGNDRTIVTVNHILISKRCGVANLVYADQIDGRLVYCYGTTSSTKDGVIIMKARTANDTPPSAFLYKSAKTLKRGEVVYIPVINFETGSKSIMTSVVVKKHNRVKSYDDFGVGDYWGVVSITPSTNEGSSGSPVVNENLELVGVVIAGNDKLSYIVPVEGLIYEEPHRVKKTSRTYHYPRKVCPIDTANTEG